MENTLIAYHPSPGMFLFNFGTDRWFDMNGFGPNKVKKIKNKKSYFDQNVLQVRFLA